ncbi:MAG: dipeptide ABC transporter ATP-binding protein [Myxococcota bacterium]|nr:dipeptide ABC transporter ATP-binding protein [Myxococcota bacterium]
MHDPESVLEIEGLKTYFHTEDGVVKAVDDISLGIRAGRTLGVVGESGSGKSVTSLTVMGLLPEAISEVSAAKISFLGRDLQTTGASALRKMRGKEMAMIFQEPMTSLNPVFTVGEQVMEALRLHEDISKEEARERTISLFDEVGIPDPSRSVDRYPHEMSGGQKQRVMIAMALSCNPRLLIADEPTTALDVTIQAQILDLIRELRDRRGMAVLFITHDLGVIGEIADDVAVMFRGKLVECGEVGQIFENPQHPYTRGLLSCRPRLDSTFKRLPTVTDFMEVQEDAGGNPVVVAKDLGEERFDELVNSGRGKMPHSDEPPILEVEDLKVYFPLKKGMMRRTYDYVRAVDGISFKVHPRQTLGLVGESGCGKTTTGRAILRLVEPTGGTVRFRPSPESDLMDLSKLQGAELRAVRKDLQIIFQDPYSSLNPRMPVESLISEPMLIHGIGSSAAERRDRCVSLLEEVGLGGEHLRRFPHEFSGGQRQRICIARTLAIDPSFIICDESVSALDVSVQAQVLNLLKELQEKRGLSYIFISHDLSVVKFMSDVMAVMNAGKIVEMGPAEEIYKQAEQDYTRRLIDSIPNDSLDNIRRRQEERIAAQAERARNPLQL